MFFFIWLTYGLAIIFLDPRSLILKVVSIGAFLTFYVVFAPLEYIPTITKRLHFFGSFFLLRHQLFSVLFKQREGLQSINSAFLTAQGRLIHRYLRL